MSRTRRSQEFIEVLPAGQTPVAHASTLSVESDFGRTEPRNSDLYRQYVGLWERDLRTNDVKFSREFAKLLGFTKKDELPDSFEFWSSRLHPDDRGSVLDTLNQSIESGKSYKNEYRFLTRSQGYRWFEAIAVVHYDESGAPVKLTGSLKDIHEHKVEHLAQRKLYEIQVSDQLSVDEKISALMTLGLNALSVQSAFIAKALLPEREILYSAGETIAGNVGTRFKMNARMDLLRANNRQLLSVFGNNDRLSHPLYYCRLSQPISYYLGVPFKVNGLKFGFIGFIDTAERNQPLSEWQVTFAKILSQCISRELSQKIYIRELEASNQKLERFAYIASHDLQEPLRKITTCCRLLDSELKDSPSEDVQELLQITVRSAKQMRALTSDILELATIQQEESKAVAVNLEPLIAEVVGELRDDSDRVEFQLDMDDMPILHAIPNHISMLFQNLISNAVKFNSSAIPEIKIWAVEDDAQTRIWVADNGIGIPKEHGSKVFDVFQRLHSRQEFPGTGIGLAITREVVRQYGGDIWIDYDTPNPLGGTTFCLTFPHTIQD